ncbi:MAG: hypothetical protein PWP15_1588, partial [Methanothermococcus sp.]|nr:hypothetical protein [Methanothermococcus sp.]
MSREEVIKTLQRAKVYIDFGNHPGKDRIPSVKALNQLIKVMRENKFSLVHVHTPVGAFLGRLAAKITNTKPVLYTAHGFHFYKGAPLKNWLIYYPMERIAAHWTDGLITMNEEDFNIAKKFNLRRKDAVFYVHGVGIDINKYCINDEEKRKKLREELGFSQDDILILTVAELIPRKNYFQMIDTMKNLRNNDMNLYYLIVGAGELVKSYILCKFVLVSGNGLMHFSYFLLKAIDFRA